MYLRIVQKHRNLMSQVNKEVNVVGISYIGFYYDRARFLNLNTINVSAQMILYCGRWSQTLWDGSNIYGLYLWDASSNSPLHCDTRNVSRCCQISPGVGFGVTITPAWEPLTTKEPLVIKVSARLFFFFFHFVDYLLVCAQSMEINAYCALELDNSFFLACVAWDKLPNLSESQFPCLSGTCKWATH